MEKKKLKLNYTPEMIMDIKNVKGFDYKKHDAEVAETIKKVVLEDLAWKLWQNDFKSFFNTNKLPVELTNKEHFLKIFKTKLQVKYFDRAEKIYQKRLKAAQNKKYPVIEISPDGENGMMGGAYCLCFVYSKYKGNVLLKGYMREVEKYLKKNFTHYFCNFSLWYNGHNRDIWRFWKDMSVTIYEPDKSSRIRKREKFEVVKYDRNKDYNDNGYELARFKFKRLPKRWIPEFDKL